MQNDTKVLHPTRSSRKYQPRPQLGKFSKYFHDSPDSCRLKRNDAYNFYSVDFINCASDQDGVVTRIRSRPLQKSKKVN